jgi:hypothetical protein
LAWWPSDQVHSRPFFRSVVGALDFTRASLLLDLVELADPTDRLGTSLGFHVLGLHKLTPNGHSTLRMHDLVTASGVVIVGGIAVAEQRDAMDPSDPRSL